MKSLLWRAGRIRSPWSAAVPLILVAATAQADQTRQVNIPRGDLATVLTQIALTSSTPIVAPAQFVAWRMAGPISGCGTTETALIQALAGTASAVESDRNGGFLVHSLAVVDARAAAMCRAKEEPAAGTAPSSRALVPAGIISDRRTSAHLAPVAGDCRADEGTYEVTDATSGLVRLEAQ